jgi:hypothetical protein
MRKPPPLPPGSKEKLYLALKSAHTKAEYRMVLCLWLRAALQMTSEQIAIALGLSRRGVLGIQAGYLHEGEAMFKRAGKGGRHRQNLSVAAERAFLDGLLERTKPANAIMNTMFIQQAYEDLVGRPVTYSVIYRMLKRHDWRYVKMRHVATPRGWAAAKLAPEDDPPTSRAEFEAEMGKCLGG